MSFLWGGKKPKNPPPNGPLPPATRDISSSHGLESRAPTANGVPVAGSRDGMERRATVGNNQAPPSTMNPPMAPLGPEPPRIGRERADSDLMVPPGNRAAPVRPQQGDSPYPWSQRRLNFSSNLTPFPRYGAAVNATASRWVYIMGGLVNSQTVKGDLWMIDLTNGAMSCYPVNTIADGPGPRVGHASLLVGNAFIVFGGDTKLEDGDVLDDTLYLLNTSSKQWARASPSGSRPAGRYGHTLNIVGSKIYIFGGQVEGYFFNDLVAFDLNTLQVAGNRWEILIPNGGNGAPLPAPRTNHSMVSWQEKIYLFGGTDGTKWFNDVWTYDPSTNLWTELDCIGYIPAAREGHAAALINDVMYIFGGRVQDGTDLGDLVAFKISTRRWYMFQNMGASPSPRSGHSMTAFGNHIIVLAGEPSSAPRDVAELSLAYVLDTTKIRYPSSEPAAVQPMTQAQPMIQAPPQQQPPPQPQQGPMRNFSNDRAIPPKSGAPLPVSGQSTGSRSESPQQNGARAGTPGTRSAGASTPQQQPTALKVKDAAALRAKTPSRGAGTPQFDREPISPTKETIQPDQQTNGGQASQPTLQSKSTSANPSRTGSRLARQQASIDSDVRDTPRASVDTPGTHYSRDDPVTQVDSGVGSSPALNQMNEELAKELEAAKSRNAWYASELALARKSGYQPSSSGNPILDQQAAEVFGDDDRPLIEALLRMKSELSRVQGSIDAQSEATATRIAEIEKQRDVAISEAAYAKAKLAAHGGTNSQVGTPQPDALRGSVSPDLDRANEMSRRLAAALSTHKDLNSKIETLESALEAEKRARRLAEETSEAADKRISELDGYKQRTAGELETLRAELHEAQKLLREESTNAAEAHAARKLLEADKSELLAKHTKISESSKDHSAILQSLKDAVTASTEKADHLEQSLEQEKALRADAEQKLIQLKVEHEQRSGDVESLSRRLADAETLASKHAQEAKTHREAVLSGLGAVTSRSLEESSAVDERVQILSQQLDAANSMTRQHRESADNAAERLRRAEERIAGLEAYQEQTSRENLTIRKQAQLAMKELQSIQSEKAETQHRLERSLLDSNALEVQLKTLKHLLEERGVNPADVRRSRVLESPGSRYGTPDLGRMRDLERQLDESMKANEEMRQVFETREQEVTREWEEKIQTLSNDHQGTIKYVRGLEKVLNKMKAELQRSKSVNAELEKEVAASKSASESRALNGEVNKELDAEREKFRKEMEDAHKKFETSVSGLESQISTLKKDLAESEAQRNKISAKMAAEHDNELRELSEAARAELETMRRENKLLEARAQDAEHKVQMFLDQFETSMDNYRRMSRLEQGPTGRSILGAKSDADSLYSTTTADEEDEDVDTETESGPATGKAGESSAAKKSRDRTSKALDMLTNELESLRSNWETTRGNYKLNDKFEFEKALPSDDGMTGRESLSTWARSLGDDTDSIESQESAERLMQMTPNKKTGKKATSLTSNPTTTKT